MSSAASMFSQSFFHGTRADLKPGDLVVVGHPSNFTDVKPISWVYFSATLDAAIWGAELAAGSERERIYVVEPTGRIVDDPNLTNKKFHTVKPAAGPAMPAIPRLRPSFAL
jgi:Rifampin ADP-ribosyl transferase